MVDTWKRCDYPLNSLLTVHFSMSQAAGDEKKERKSRSSQAVDSRRLRKEKDKFKRYIKYLDGQVFLGCTTAQVRLWLRAFKTFAGTQHVEPFDEFVLWVQDAVNKDIEDNKDSLSLAESLDEKRKRIARYREIFDECVVLQAMEYLSFNNMVREILREQDAVVDPEISDKVIFDLYMRLVGPDIRADVEFKDTTGNGWVYNRQKFLWLPYDAKQMHTHIYQTTGNAFRFHKFIFSSAAAETYWQKRIGDLTTYNGLVSILKGSMIYPNQLEQKLDKKEWVIPVMNQMVFDCADGETRLRQREDYFTEEAQFEYYEDQILSSGIIVNDTKTREQLLGGSLDDHRKVINTLFSLFPNAMKFVSSAFNNEDRLWFILCRLGLLLSGFCCREILFVWGKGKGGKSTLFQTVAEVCGKLAVVMMKSSFLKNKTETGSSHKTDMIRALGRRMVLVDECESSDVMNETLLKNWASHQKIPMREIYGKQNEELLKSYLIFLSNEPPRFSQEDTTIRERIRAVRGTTKYFDKFCPKAERPYSYNTDDDKWVDQYVDTEDTYWIYRTPEKEEFSRSFRTDPEKRNELGTLLCILTAIIYRLTKNGKSTQLPIPDIVQKDSKRFFEESDVVETFLSEYFVDEHKYANAVTLRDVYDKFRQTFPELGIKSFTLQTFKRSLSGKNLLFPVRGHQPIKVKKAWRSNSTDVYTVT